MTIEGSVKFIYQTKTTGHPQYHEAYPDMIDDQTITMEAPSTEMNVYQHFNLFNSFLRAVGFDELTIMRGATGLAFSDMRKDEDMRKVADEHDIMMSEHHDRIVSDLEKEILDLKAKLSRFENPSNPNYTDEEMDAMTAWNGSIPGSPSAIASGCKCPVMDNEEMPEERKWVNADCPIHGKVK
jgi:hypothetical protein